MERQRQQVIAATNRPDVLDPALLRSGRLDRKIELPHPSEEARGRILQIHSRKMNVDKGEKVEQGASTRTSRGLAVVRTSIFFNKIEQRCRESAFAQ